MSRSATLQERDALAVRLRELTDRLAYLQDLHCEQLCFENYDSLSMHVAELQMAVRMLQADNLSALLEQIIDDANSHIAFVEEAYGSEGDA